MRIDKENEKALLTCMYILKLYKGMSKSTLLSSIKNIVSQKNKQFSEQEVESHALNLAMMYESILNNPKVEYVASTLIRELKLTFPALIERIGDNTISQELGNQSAIFSYDDVFVLCAIKENKCCFEVWKKNNKAVETEITYAWSEDANLNAFFSAHSQEDKYSETWLFAKLTLAVLLFKKYAEVRETVIGSNVRRKVENVSEPVWNKLPFQINYLDSTWYTTLVKNGDFPVKAHWRWCPISQRFTFIHSFMKHGYMRRAKKLCYA